MDIESIKELQQQNFSESRKIFQDGINLYLSLPNIISNQRIGQEVPTLADMESDFSESFSMRLDPAGGKTAALFIEKGMQNRLREMGIYDMKDFDIIPINNPENACYIYWFIKSFSMSKYDFNNKECFKEEIIKGLSKLPSEIFTSENGIRSLKQLLNLYSNAYYNQNIFAVTNEVKNDESLTSESSKDFKKYQLSKQILQSKDEITTGFIESMIGICSNNNSLIQSTNQTDDFCF